MRPSDQRQLSSRTAVGILVLALSGRPMIHAAMRHSFASKAALPVALLSLLAMTALRRGSE